MKKNKENNYISLAHELVKLFVENESLITIKLLDSNEYDHYILVLVSEDDIKRLIGYKGHNANSIRNILKAYANKNKEKIKIEFEAF